MGEEDDERRPGVWSDPRYGEVLDYWQGLRTTRLANGRPRRVCRHGRGVTLTIDPATRKPLNTECTDCNSAED